MNFTIKKHNLLYLFLLIPFIKPGEYLLGNFIENLFDVWRGAASLIILIHYIRKAKISPIVIFVSLFQISTIISTIMNISNAEMALWKTCITAFANIGFCMLFEIGLTEHPVDFLKIASSYGIFMSLISSATIFLFYPEGMYTDILGNVNYYFLGHYNGSYFVVFTSQICCIIYCYLKHNKLTAPVIIINIIITITFLYVQSMAASVALILIWFYLIFLKNNPFPKILNMANYLAVCICTCLGFVFFNIQYMFSFIIVDILHKNLTLTGRTVLWQKAIEYIKLSPFFGYGQESLTIMLSKFRISHIHNIMLDITYQSGLIGFSLYAIIIILCTRKLMKYRNHKYAAFISFALFLYLLISIFDYYNSKYFVQGLFVIAYHIDKIIACENTNDTDTGIKENMRLKYLKYR